MAEYRFSKDEAKEIPSRAGALRPHHVRSEDDPNAQCSMGIFRFEQGVVSQAHARYGS